MVFEIQLPNGMRLLQSYSLVPVDFNLSKLTRYVMMLKTNSENLNK
jgi:hypothetical protein